MKRNYSRCVADVVTYGKEKYNDKKGIGYPHPNFCRSRTNKQTQGKNLTKDLHTVLIAPIKLC